MDVSWRRVVGSFILLCLLGVAYGATNLHDMKILNDFRKGLENPELLKWPGNGDDPCGSKWPHVYCSGDRVTQIQVQGMGLKGPLPQNFNQLSKLYNLGLQKNNFNGKLPSFNGLVELQYAYLDNNDFDTIPTDFFNGLTSLSVMALDHIPLNASTGWSIPDELGKSEQLQNLSLIQCNLVGQVPEFLGTLPNLKVLQLSFNKLTGDLPKSFGQSLMQILWLNNQDGGGMTGPIDVIGSMSYLTQVWLHGNKFMGTIPDNIGDLLSLKELNLNGNQLVGQIPQALADLKLDKLDLGNNHFMGPIPKFQSGSVTYSSNAFCQPDPELQCSPQVTALLDFLSDLSYPSSLTSDWSGNDPCQGWSGISCNPQSKVSVINLPRHNLTGTLSPSLVKLDSLIDIRLSDNDISGTVPANLTQLKSLRSLDISGNNIEPPIPKFRDSLKIITDGNPLLATNTSAPPPIPPPPIPLRNPPKLQAPPSADNPPTGTKVPIRSPVTPSPPPPTSSTSSLSEYQPKNSKISKKIIVVAGVATMAVFVVLLLLCSIYWCKYRKSTLESPCSIVVHPRDLFDPKNKLKIAVSNNTTGSLSTKTGTTFLSNTSSGTESSHTIEAGNLIISVQLLRKVTNNFGPENELGHGGFGTVYKGEVDGTCLAVKRMEGGVVSSKGLDEFQAEITVLSKVRHRHLVSLLGYSIEGSERLLVYEYMSQGALSMHLFHWETLNLKPLSWNTRLTIALDVARGIEYLHNLARQTFIHRDLKSSNILLDDHFRAKVSDFGLVKLAPDGEKSVATRLAGTFGYLAPEYAVMGKITTKVDVFSFGVVLMELVTGLMALDEKRPEESRYLAEWFWRIKSSKETLVAAIDPTIEVTEETFESISLIAELSGHCTAREPSHRPDMGHAVNVLGQLAEKWKPVDEDSEILSGIDYNQPLSQMLKDWQEAESREVSHNGLDDTQGSIPARPAGLAYSFSSVDGR